MIPYPGDPEYAKTRLDETIVLVGDKPVEVKGVILGGGRGPDLTQVFEHIRKPKPKQRIKQPVWVRYLESGDQDVVPMAEVDPTPAPLGYVNFEGVASYITRVPKREDWRQGIRYNNIKSISGVSAQDIPYSALAPTIVGDFPDFDRCCELVTDYDWESIAWHRDWAMDDNGYIHYQSERVGHIVEGRVALDEDKQWLQEALDESY